jgi:hypothetical protein
VGGTKFVATVAVSASGSAVAGLPTAAGTDINKPPALACYQGSPGGTVWLSVAGTPGAVGAYCGLVFQSGAWVAVMVQAIPGNVAAFVVIY